MYKWQRIANDLRDRINRGDIAPSEALPSESELADKYRVTHSTVRRALVELRIEGLVMPEQGRGVRVLERIEPIL